MLDTHQKRKVLFFFKYTIYIHHLADNSDLGKKFLLWLACVSSPEPYPMT